MPTGLAIAATRCPGTWRAEYPLWLHKNLVRWASDARRFQVEELVVALLPDFTQCELDSHQESNKISPESTGSEAHRTTGIGNVGGYLADQIS